MMILSVSECVVRRGLNNEKSLFIGPGQIKMKKTTLKSILEIFDKIL
jgi:hypothetical protein